MRYVDRENAMVPITIHGHVDVVPRRLLTFQVEGTRPPVSPQTQTDFCLWVSLPMRYTDHVGAI